MGRKQKRHLLLVFAGLLASASILEVSLPAVASAQTSRKKKGKKKDPEPKRPVVEPKKSKPQEPPPPVAPQVPPELRGPTRIDFDDRLIQGQTNKSGAVYLFDRKETGISSMVRRRKSWKQLTLSTVYDR